MSILNNTKMTIDAIQTNDDIPMWNAIQQTESPTRAAEGGLLVYDATAQQYKRLPDATDPISYPVIDSAAMTQLVDILAKLITAPATEAKQDTANLSLASIATNTAAGATQVTAAAILAAIPSGYATAALQGTGNTKLDSIISALAGYLKQVLYNSAGTEILTETTPGVTKIGSAGIVVPMDKQAVYRVNLFSTTTILGPSPGAYTSASYDGLTLKRVTGSVYADQAGELHFEHSLNGTNWRRTRSITVVASTPQTFDEPFYSRYQRLVYANGATAQGAFELVAYSAAE
jgi:hypothetical protein